MAENTSNFKDKKSSRKPPFIGLPAVRFSEEYNPFIQKKIFEEKPSLWKVSNCCVIFCQLVWLWNITPPSFSNACLANKLAHQIVWHLNHSQKCLRVTNMASSIPIANKITSEFNENTAHRSMGVSKNSGTPKWMVYNGNPMKMDDLGIPLFLETPKYLEILFGVFNATHLKKYARQIGNKSSPSSGVNIKNRCETTTYKVGPLPVITGVITPISRVITPVTHL